MSKDETLTEIPGVHFVVPENAIRSVNLNSILSEQISVDCYDLNQVFEKHIDELDSARAAPIQLMIGITGYHVDPDHSTEPFKPMLVIDGKRSLTPNDLISEQIDVLAAIAPSIKNAGLRARLADVAWFIQRKRRNMAELAVNSYCECIEQVQSGDATFAFNDQSPWGMHAKDVAVRAARISYANGWKLESSSRLKNIICDLIKTAKNNSKANDFLRIADLAIDHKLLPLEDLAKQAEGFASRSKFSDAIDLKLNLWQAAARCYGLIHDNESQNRCMIAFAEGYVEKANSASSPMVTAKFLQDALQVLRNLPGTRELRDGITNQLHEVRPRIRDEIGTISTEIDLTKFAKQSIASIQGLSWPAAFLSLILCGRPPQPEAVRAEATQYMKKFPLPHTIPTEVFDSQGRVKFRSSGSRGDAEAREEHLRRQMAINRGYARQVIVTGVINPIRRTIAVEHTVSAEAVLEMISSSPFIPLGHEYIFARGITQFLGGCDLEAGALLIPQLENSLRYVLFLKGVDTTTSDENGLQTEASLAMLLSPNKPWQSHLEELIPTNCIHEVDLLFNFAGGPSIRNQVAHGKVPATGFWHHELVYAVWLVIHLAALPLAQDWGNVEETYARFVGLVSSNESDEN